MMNTKKMEQQRDLYQEKINKCSEQIHVEILKLGEVESVTAKTSQNHTLFPRRKWIFYQNNNIFGYNDFSPFELEQVKRTIISAADCLKNTLNEIIVESYQKGKYLWVLSEDEKLFVKKQIAVVIELRLNNHPNGSRVDLLFRDTSKISTPSVYLDSNEKPSLLPTNLPIIILAQIALFYFNMDVVFYNESLIM